MKTDLKTDASMTEKIVTLRTILGTENFNALGFDVLDDIVLAPGEDLRIRLEQLSGFCGAVIQKKTEFSSDSLRYVLSLLELKQGLLARALGFSEGMIAHYLSGENKITKKTSRFFALAFLWELKSPGYISTLAKNQTPARGTPEEVISIPITELQQRGYITLSDNPKEVASSTSNFFKSSNFSETNAVYRKAAIYSSCPIDVNCWLQIIHTRSNETRMVGYNKELLSERLAELLDLTSGLLRIEKIREILNECGVHFLIEPNFNSTHLDGAASISSSGNPILALTLRYDRIDNFWFTFFHEIAHIMLDHIHQNTIVEDTSASSNHSIEREADHWAEAQLIPQELRSIDRKTKITSKLVSQLSTQLNRHPGILVGYFQRERMLRYDHPTLAREKIRISPLVQGLLKPYHLDSLRKKSQGL